MVCLRFFRVLTPRCDKGFFYEIVRAPFAFMNADIGQTFFRSCRSVPPSVPRQPLPYKFSSSNTNYVVPLPPLPRHFLQLHVLSALLLAPTAVSLRRLSSPGKAWVSRLAARSDTRVALQGLLARGGRAVAPGRLEHLVSQVK